MGLFLGSVLFFIDFFCLSWCQQHTVWTTVVFYNKSWNQVALVLQVCSSFAELGCPFQVLCISVLNLESACQCLKKSSQAPSKYLVPTSDAQWVTVQCDGWKNYYLTGVKILGLLALCLAYTHLIQHKMRVSSSLQITTDYKKWATLWAGTYANPYVHYST